MRDINRIPIVLDKLSELWKMFPDFRLCQLITALVGQDNFYKEDEDLLKAIEIMKEKHVEEMRQDVVFSNNIEHVRNVYDCVIRMLSNYNANDSMLLHLETNLFDGIGLDSLDAVELLLEAEKTFNIEILDKEAEELYTIKDVLELILYKKKIKNTIQLGELDPTRTKVGDIIKLSDKVGRVYFEVGMPRPHTFKDKYYKVTECISISMGTSSVYLDKGWFNTNLFENVEPLHEKGDYQIY